MSIALICAASASAVGQEATIVYRMGRDTVAIERFLRTSGRMSGESVVRHGDLVARTQYEVTLDRGRVTALVVRERQADGSPIAGIPVEWRLTLGKDSALRMTVWPDSTQRKSFAVANAFFLLPIVVSAPAPQSRRLEVFVYSHALFELLYAAGAARDSMLAIPLQGNAARTLSLRSFSADLMRFQGGPPSAELMRFDREGRLLSTDGASVIGTRVAGSVDIAAAAAKMKPTGVLSPRAAAYAEFDRGPIFINYGRPSMRGRSAT